MQAWNAANLENVNGNYGGRMSSASTLSRPQKLFLKELGDSGRTAEIIKLKAHAPNPNTPNLTLGKQYGDLFDKDELYGRQAARTQYNLGKGELKHASRSIVNDYWANPRQTDFAKLKLSSDRSTPSSRRLADSLVQHGYNYDPSVARDIARKRGTDQEYFLQQIQDLLSKGVINSEKVRQP